MSTVKEHQSVTVPRLNLKLLGSKSAPNSARSTKSEEKIKNRKPKINSTNTKLRTDEGRCTVQRREFKPVHVRYSLYKFDSSGNFLLNLFQNKDSIKDDKIPDCRHRTVCPHSGR